MLRISIAMQNTLLTQVILSHTYDGTVIYKICSISESDYSKSHSPISCVVTLAVCVGH